MIPAVADPPRRPIGVRLKRLSFKFKMPSPLSLFSLHNQAHSHSPLHHQSTSRQQRPLLLLLHSLSLLRTVALASLGSRKGTLFSMLSAGNQGRVHPFLRSFHSFRALVGRLGKQGTQGCVLARTRHRRQPCRHMRALVSSRAHACERNGGASAVVQLCMLGE